MMKIWLGLLALITRTYGEPLYHIVVHSSFGSRSHASFMLELTDILSHRGHRVTFAATTEKLKFSSGYNATTYDLGSYPGYDHEVQKTNDKFILSPVRVEPQPFIAQLYNKTMVDFYKITFPKLDDLIKHQKPDVVLCDLFSPACQDVARKNGIPLIIGTQSPEMSGLIKAPFLTEDMSQRPATTDKIGYWEKFQDKVLEPIQTIINFIAMAGELNTAREQFGVPPFHEGLFRVEGSLVLADIFMGLSPGFHIPPTVKLVGPIIPSQTSTLDEATTSFMTGKTSVMYASFGTEIRMAPFDFETILLSTIELLETGSLDGLIWSLGLAKLEEFPNTLVYKNITYPTSELLTKFQDKLLLRPWSPQSAILNHSSTTVFLTHGGLNSIHESIAANKPLVCYPITADQPRNSYKVLDAGIGLRVDRYHTSPEELASEIQTIIIDSTGKFKSNLARLRAITHLDSPASFQRLKVVTADLIETHIRTADACRSFSGPGCELEHFQLASRHLSFLQAHNLDIWLPILFTFLSILIIVCLLVKRLLVLAFALLNFCYQKATGPISLSPSKKSQ